MTAAPSIGHTAGDINAPISDDEVSETLRQIARSYGTKTIEYKAMLAAVLTWELHRWDQDRRSRRTQEILESMDVMRNASKGTRIEAEE